MANYVSTYSGAELDAGIAKAETAYQKPSGGIPATDFADAYGEAKNPYGTKSASYVLSGPVKGSAAAVPTFRALVSDDISDIEFMSTAEALTILNS